MNKIALGTECENYRKSCLESEHNSKMDEMRCMRCMLLEVEVEDLKKKNKELEEQISLSNGEDEKMDEENESNEFVQLMIENQVLECEKTKAESDLCFWKQKARELESKVWELESKVNTKDMDESTIGANDEKIPKCAVEEVRCLNKKIAPSTPCVAPSLSSKDIDIIDEDVNYNEIPKVTKLSDENLDEDDMDGFIWHSQTATPAKRKRCSNMITSDDDEDDTKDHKGHSPKIIISDEETSDDDNAPICTLIRQHGSRLNTDTDVSSRPLTRARLRKSETKNREDDSIIDLYKTKNSSSEDDADEDSQSEDESLDGFIVKSSETGSGSDNSCEESEDESNEFRVTLDKISRKKDSKMKWDLEGDMLADFGKDPELCMRAVCVVYRQQTADEKVTQGTIHHNGRGFSQPDARRASELAEFLTDGDSGGDLNKTVEELKEYDSKGVKRCMKLAARYSKQLFEIYQKKEDPYFLPR